MKFLLRKYFIHITFLKSSSILPRGFFYNTRPHRGDGLRGWGGDRGEDDEFIIKTILKKVWIKADATVTICPSKELLILIVL